MIRDKIKSSLHDSVIEETVKQLNPENYDIYTNSGQSKRAGIAGNYPDIVLTDKGTKTVKFIIEVKTEDTINIIEAEKQWKKYATEINATFYLVVPQSKKKLAQDLCYQIGISVRFASYRVVQSKIEITFE